MTSNNYLASRLLAAGRAAPHLPFAETFGGADDAWSYGDLIARSAQFAHALAARGVVAGDRVAVQASKSIEVIALHLGVLRAGAVYVPMNTGYTEREVTDLTADCDAALLVNDSGTTSSASPTLSIARLCDDASAAEATFDDVGRDADDFAAILYTSGTTGRPKGAVMTHGGLAFSAHTLGTSWGFTVSDRLVHILPLFHTHGLFVAIHLTLLAGASVSLHDRFDVDATLADLERSTVLMGVPTHYTRLLASKQLTPERCASMRLFTSGSAPMLATTHAAFSEATGRHIVERYGMTETCILTSNPLDGPWKPGTVGPPLPGVGLRVVVPKQADTDVGAIQVRGPNLLAEYWGRPDATADSYTNDGWFVTGDLGRIDGDGYVEIVGRAKDLIITGGLNVYPKEVELIIGTHPDVVESAVFGTPDDDFGEQVNAAIVVAPGTTIDHDTMRTWCKARMAAYKAPKRFVIVDELPRNTMGKIQKVVLATLHS